MFNYYYLFHQYTFTIVLSAPILHYSVASSTSLYVHVTATTNDSSITVLVRELMLD
jgi:hypothetical protein